MNDEEIKRSRKNLSQREKQSEQYYKDLMDSEKEFYKRTSSLWPDKEEMQALKAEGERVTGSSGNSGTPKAETNTGRYGYDIDVLMERWDKILRR